MSKEVLPTPESPTTITFTSRLIVTKKHGASKHATVQRDGAGRVTHERTEKGKKKERKKSEKRRQSLSDKTTE